VIDDKAKDIASKVEEATKITDSIKK